MPKTAVVILNWNGINFLQRFLPIVIKKTPDNLARIIVADNGSNDGSLEYLSNITSVQTIKFDKNYGFTGGYNKAFDILKEEKYQYYLLLNSDVEVTDRWLDTLIEFMESHPKAGICSPKIKSYANPHYFEHAGACGGYIDKFGFPYCRGRILSLVEKDSGQYEDNRETFWASGASFLIRAELWHQLGGLDNTFFAHMEEIDLCWRAKLSGQQVWVVPESEIYHVGGGTLPNESPNKLYLNFRNNLLMIYKNSGTHRRKNIFIRKNIDRVIALIYILTGKSEFAKVISKAHKDFEKLKKEVKITEIKNKVKYGDKTLIRLWFETKRSIKKHKKLTK